MDDDRPITSKEDPWTAEETAIYALAEAMAYRSDPIAPQVTEDILQRAKEIVTATLDIAGRRFVVLVRDSEADARRLVVACGKNGEHVGEGLRVIDKLTDMPADVLTD